MLKFLQQLQDYPELKNDDKIPVEVYSMSGWFKEDHNHCDKVYAVIFAGYFKYNKEDNTIRGELVDSYGKSIIDGVMTETS